MDPYLERHWGDVHSSIIFVAKQAFQQQLGGDLVARSEERIYNDDDETLRQQGKARMDTAADPAERDHHVPHSAAAERAVASGGVCDTAS